jgi:hypothetical protein
MTELSRKVGEMSYDGLITDLNPPVQVRGRTIAKLAAPVSYKRGTIFSRSLLDKKLYIIGSTAAAGDTLVPDCVLCDDIEVGIASDANVAVYTAGCFDPNKTAAAAGYTITEGNKDELRQRSIVFKAAFDSI